MTRHARLRGDASSWRHRRFTNRQRRRVTLTRSKSCVERSMSVAFEERVGVRELARAGRLVVRLAAGRQDVEAAQRLRWRVFAEECGARLTGDRPGLDRDPFDRFCEHLIVEDESIGEVVGTYRVLFPESARCAGGLYIETEFYVQRLEPVRGTIVELGRSCVHRDYRSGGAIMLLWAGLGELLAGTAYRYLIGCASVPGEHDGRYAASLWRRLWADHAAPEPLRVFPRRPLVAEPLAAGCEVVVPPLLKGYLRAGAMLLGEPHVDDAFGCVDVPVLLPLERLASRYARRFARA
jgi:putative hemolysin